MLLQSKKFQKIYNIPEKVIGLSQLCLTIALLLFAIGIFASRISQGNHIELLNTLNWNMRIVDFISGITMGLGFVIMGLSIAFNIRGMQKRKKI